jgi:hypothetical protein
MIDDAISVFKLDPISRTRKHDKAVVFGYNNEYKAASEE